MKYIIQRLDKKGDRGASAFLEFSRLTNFRIAENITFTGILPAGAHLNLKLYPYAERYLKNLENDRISGKINEKILPRNQNFKI